MRPALGINLIDECMRQRKQAGAGYTENGRGHEDRDMGLFLCAKRHRVAFGGMTFFSNFWDYFIEAQTKVNTL